MKLIHKQISTSFDMKLESVDPIIPQSKYHLSLTRTLYVKDYQRELFQSKIAEALKKTLINFPLPESIKTEKFSVYLNDEKTRTFIAIDLENDENILKYIEVIDGVLKEFAFPPYYTSPKLHFSLFWCKGNCGNDIVFNEEEIELERIELKQIMMKCGNKLIKY